jgi:hypothetical protein
MFPNCKTHLYFSNLKYQLGSCYYTMQDLLEDN